MRKFISTAFFALGVVSAAAQGGPGNGPGPGPTPDPWRVNGPTISYSNGGVALPASVTGGGKGVGTVNVSQGYYVAGNPLAFGNIAGLGTAAQQNIGTSGATVPLLSTANTWSTTQTYATPLTVTAPTFGLNFSNPGNAVATVSSEFDHMRVSQPNGQPNQYLLTQPTAVVAGYEYQMSSVAGSVALSNMYGGIGAVNNLGHGTTKGLYGRANCTTALSQAVCVSLVAGMDSGLNQSNSWGIQINDNQSLGPPGGLVGGVWLGSALATPAVYDYGVLLDNFVNIRAGGSAFKAYAIGPGDFLSFINSAGTANLFEVQADGSAGVGGIGAKALVGTEGLAIKGYAAVGTPGGLIGLFGNTGDGTFKIGTRSNDPVNIWVNQGGVGVTAPVATFDVAGVHGTFNYTLPSTGAITRTLQQKASDYTSILDFSAAPSTTNFNQAIAAVGASALHIGAGPYTTGALTSPGIIEWPNGFYSSGNTASVEPLTPGNLQAAQPLTYANNNARYLKSVRNSNFTALSMYSNQLGFAPIGATFDGIQSVLELPPGSTIGQMSALGGYIRNRSTGTVFGPNAVSLFGICTAEGVGSFCWGVNTIVQDGPTRAPGTTIGDILIGYENDIVLLNPNTLLLGISIGGNSLAQPTTSLGYVVNSLGALPDGKIRGATIQTGGAGYTTATVAFSGGGGTGAAATVQMSGGAVTGITMTNTGTTPYTSPPTATISGNGTGATVTALLGTGITWGAGFASQAGTSRTGLSLGAVSDGTSANATSQDIELGWRDTAGLPQSDVIRSTNGFLQILSTSAAWNGLSIGGNISGGSITGSTVTSTGSVVGVNGVLPTVFGGGAPTSILTLTSTFGVGTADAIIFQTAAQVERARILNSGVFKFAAPSFTANGTVATALTTLGPVGSHTTVQEWFTVQDSSGNVRYIPAF